MCVCLYKPSVLSLKNSSFSSSQPSMTYTGNKATLSIIITFL